MRKYEIMFILDMDTADQKSVAKKLTSILTDKGGKIVESEEWGLKKFAYPINKKKEGFYFVYIVETSSENINEFERVSRIDKNVVRTLVINTENEKKYIQSTKLSKTDMSKYKEERKERQNRGFKNNYKKPENNNEGQVSETVKTSEVKKEATTENVESK